MRAALVLLLCWPLALFGAELRPGFDAAAVAADDLLEWEVADPDPAWLVGDVQRTPRLVVTPPQGPAWTRRCFLYQEHAARPDGVLAAAGSPALRVRHAPRLPGVHRWELQSPAGAVLARGEVAVAAARGPVGPIRVSADNPRLLAFPDGTPFIAIGPNLGWADGPDRLAAFTRFFGLLRDNGCTHVRVWFASWCGQVQGDTPDALRLDQAWLMDRVLALARAHGVRVTLVLDNFHDLLTGRGAPWGATRDERIATFIDAGPPPAWRDRLRYVLARWGADDTVLAWEPINELDMAQPVRERALPWAVNALAAIGAEDADHRLRTLSWAGGDWARAMSLPGVDLAQYRAYVYEFVPGVASDLADYSRDGVGMLVEDAERGNALGRPFILAECGFQGESGGNPGNELDRHGMLLRQQTWAGLLLGGCGSGMNWWWDTYIDRYGLWPVYRGLAATAARIDWRDRELAPLAIGRGGALRILGWQSPRQALLWPQHRLDTWHSHLMRGLPRPAIAAELRMAMRGMIAGARYRITELAMADGAAGASREAAADSGGTLTIAVPAGMIDRVLLIERIP